jgi:hypothetical protein
MSVLTLLPPSVAGEPSIGAEGTPSYRHRFHVYLPTLYNDKRSIPLPRIQSAFKELEDKFGGYTTSSPVGTPRDRGYWKNPATEKVYFDFIYIIHIDVVDNSDLTNIRSAIQFFQRFRLKYTKVFKQNEIYITFENVTKIE